VKNLRTAIGDYDSQDVQHHKVLKTIFLLVKKLIKIAGEYGLTFI